jgi:hypothetical protein
MQLLAGVFESAGAAEIDAVQVFWIDQPQLPD